MDIHNGISNPNFTYTGGQSLVPDENGILRYTPPGVPAIEGGRYIDTVADGAELGPELVVDLNLSIIDVGGSSGQVNSTTHEISNIAIGTANYAPYFVKSVGLPRYSLLRVAGRLSGNLNNIYSVTANRTSSSFTAYGIGGLSGTDLRTAGGVFSFDAMSLVPSFALWTDGRTIWDGLFLEELSILEIIPRWERPTGSTYISIPTRKGTRQVQTDPEFLGQLIEPAMTNKLTIAKANPTAVTGIVVAGGAVATVVNDLTALTAAGLHKICTTNAYNLSIPQNGTVTLPGAVANLNKHSISAELRLVSGTGIQMGLTGALANITLTDAYQRIKQENLTPLVATDLVTFKNLNADTAVVRMVLPQLEESPFCTSPIVGTDKAASQTRQANVTSAPTAGVFPSTGQDFGLYLECVATAAGQTATLLSTRVDADNLLSVSTTATAIGVNLRKTATDNAASAAYTHTADEKFQVIIVKSAMGISVKAREYSSGAWQAWGAWGNNETAGAKATSPIGTTYQIGAANSLNQFTGNYPETAIIAMPPKATLAEYQTWIEEELTRRGLI